VNQSVHNEATQTDLWVSRSWSKGFFGLDEIKLIEMASCDGLQISRLESSSDRDVSYPRLEGFARAVFDPGG